MMLMTHGSKLLRWKAAANTPRPSMCHRTAIRGLQVAPSTTDKRPAAADFSLVLRGGDLASEQSACCCPLPSTSPKSHRQCLQQNLCLLWGGQGAAGWLCCCCPSGERGTCCGLRGNGIPSMADEVFARRSVRGFQEASFAAAFSVCLVDIPSLLEFSVSSERLRPKFDEGCRCCVCGIPEKRATDFLQTRK